MSRTHVLSAVAAVVLLANVSLAEDIMDKKVKLPQRLIQSTEVLRMIHDQTGAEYAYPTGVLVRQIDATPFNGEATVKDVVAKLAPKVTDGNVIVLEVDLTDADLKDLADKLKSDKADDRRVAAYLLGNTKSTRAIYPLLVALKDRDESVRHHALRSLDRLERDFQSYCPPGRESVFRMIGEKSGQWNLAAFLEGDPVGDEWIWAAGISGRRGPVINGDMNRAPNRGVFDDATFIGEAAIHKAVRHDYARTRQTAQWVIDRVGQIMNEKTPTGASTQPQSPAAPTIQQLITHLSMNRAVFGEELADLLLKFGQVGSKAAWDIILAHLDNKDPIIRRAAIRALEHCPDPRAVTALMKIMTGPEEGGVSETQPASFPDKGLPPSASTLTAESRNLAAETLGMIATPEVLKQLTEYVANAASKGDKPVSSAALALSWVAADPENVAAVQPLLACVRVKDKDPHNQDNCVLRSYAYIGLARIGSPDAIAGIMSKYDEYDNTARYVGHSSLRLAGAWSHLEGSRAVDHFVNLVRNGKGKIAPHGLEMAEDPRAVDALIEAIPKASGDRLNFALQALGRIGDPKAIPTLVALLDHKEPWVQYEAFRALRWRWYWGRTDVQDAIKKHATFKAFVGPQPTLADQPENTWVLRQWPIDFDDYRSVNTSYEAGLTFDSSTGKAVKVNGHGQRCDTPQMGETWLFDPKASTWSQSNSPVLPFGMCGTWNLAYDESNLKIVFIEAPGGDHGWQMERARALRGSAPWVYDGKTDRWTPMNPLHQLIGPGLRAFGPLVYIGSTGKVFLQGSAWGGNSPKELVSRSWTYDTYTNTWTMLPESKETPGNPSHHGMCYLPEQDQVLLTAGGRTWLFDVKTNQWSDAKATCKEGAPPKVGLPLVYDPISRTALAFIAQENGTAIWQYDPKANEWAKVNSPVDISPHHDSVDCAYDPADNVFIMDGGHVNWNTDHIAVREVWTYKFKKAGEPKLIKVGGPGMMLAPVIPPMLPGAVVVSVMKDRTVEVDWAKSADRPVTGYNVYAATVESGNKMHHKEVWRKVGEFVKLNNEPIKEATFTDTRKLADATGLFTHEIRAYCVKGLDAKANESGPSATVLTLISSVPHAAAVEQPDGSTLITWEAPPEKDIRGYAVYRMDEFRNTLAVRLNPVPVTETRFVDWPEAPRAERRRYYVVAVDALGQEGIPSTGAWSFGRP